jgi:DNA modification methylase
MIASTKGTNGASPGDAAQASMWRDEELDQVAPEASGATGSLIRRFVVPPFTVLDSRQSYWQQRKREWIALGIKGELGRAGDLIAGPGTSAVYGGRSEWAGNRGPGRSNGQDLMKGEHVVGGARVYNDREWPLAIRGDDYSGNCAERAEGSGTSVFDPVLCEIAYRWFCPPGGSVLDPFAGEATKGIVAAVLGHPYTGIELREEQVEENRRQAERIGVEPTWVCGDSAATDRLLPKGEEYDLVFTSPPYYDLEVYSGKDEDGSAMATYGEFMAFYRHVFAQCVKRLRPNRFVVVKVGEVRDEWGMYRDFVGDNVDVFRDLGLGYYNEAILVTPAGSLPVRVGKQMVSGRKLGKSHQNVLVFFKGDPRRIREELGDGTVAGAA